MDERERALAIMEKVEDDLRFIEKETPRDFSSYAKDAKTRLSIERALQVSIEGLVDLCALVCAKARAGLPHDEEGILVCLVKAEVVSSDDARTISQLRKLRNVLVHRYVEIDDSLVHRHALRAPEIIQRFADRFREYLR